jgi:hypothetical protein
MRIAQNIPITCWSTFIGIQNVVEHIDVLFTYVAALLGYDPSGQMAVVEKMESFIGRIVQRALAYMVRMHRERKLADMWLSADICPQRQAKCEEVWPDTCSSHIHDFFVLHSYAL